MNHLIVHCVRKNQQHVTELYYIFVNFSFYLTVKLSADRSDVIDLPHSVTVEL